MITIIKTAKLTRALIAIFVSFLMVFGGLAATLKSAEAVDSPVMQVIFLGDNNDSPVGYAHNVTLNPGQYLAMRVEIHNTVVGTTAENVVVKTTMPAGNITDGQVYTQINANNASSVSDTINIHVNGGGQLVYVPNSTTLHWDQNGDGIKEYNNTPIVDGVTASGIALGNQNGCNEFVAIMFFLAKVQGKPVASPSPTPTPTPTPSPTPSPTPTPTVSPSPTPTPSPTPSPKPTPSPTPHPSHSPKPTPSPTPSPSPISSPSPTPFATPTPSPATGGINNTNNNENVNLNSSSSTGGSVNNSGNSGSSSSSSTSNSSVTINNPAPAILSAATGVIPKKTPDTGVGVLGMFSMFGAAPVGIVLSRFGKGRVVVKKEEDLNDIGHGLVASRKKKV